MAEYIKEVAETGKLLALEHTHQELPRTLVQLIQLDQLGSKKAKRLYNELGIISLSDLKTALDTGKVEALPGFGSKTLHISVGLLRRTPSTHRAFCARTLSPCSSLCSTIYVKGRASRRSKWRAAIGVGKRVLRMWIFWLPVQSPNLSCNTSSRFRL